MRSLRHIARDLSPGQTSQLLESSAHGLAELSKSCCLIAGSGDPYRTSAESDNGLERFTIMTGLLHLNPDPYIIMQRKHPMKNYTEASGARRYNYLRQGNY